MSRPDVLPTGKLPAELLSRLLGRIESADPAVVVGARHGIDAAVVDVGDRYLVLAMDPVTLSEEPGRFAVQINANDIAVMGARPRWLLAALLLPAGSTADAAASVMDQLQTGCADLGTTLVGGHTEMTPTVNRPVVVACMVGEVERDHLVTSGGARPGDVLLLAGPIAIEGTAILCRDAAPALRAAGVAEDVINRGARLIDSPGIGVLPAVNSILSETLPHAMHDPTEGGLVTALREMADASQVGLWIEQEQIPVLDACRAVCLALHLDPLGLLASGSVLAALDSASADRVRHALETAGIGSAVIGRVLTAEKGMTLAADQHRALPVFARDELARAVDNAGKAL